MPFKYSFKDDYSEGCHPSILQNLQKHNLTQKAGYGLDQFSLKAKELIRQELKNKEAAIHFVSGGTQANLIVISALLKPHESVIAAHTGHITTHEAGAIEATGHKVNSITTSDGKVRPKDIEKILQEHQLAPHMVKPKMVYISNTTELGGVYKKQELQKLYDYCQKNNLILYMDGARLGRCFNRTLKRFGFGSYCTTNRCILYWWYKKRYFVRRSYCYQSFRLSNRF